MEFCVPENYELVYSTEQVREQLECLAPEIAKWADEVEKKTGEQPLAVCILRGAVFFFSDLLRALGRSMEPTFCRTWSYSSDTNVQGTQGVRIAVDTVAAHGRAILLVDDICDSGATLLTLQNVFQELGAAEVKSAVMVSRLVPETRYKPTWSAFQYPGPEWFVGYGMDDKNHYSNLPGVYILK